MKIVHKIFSLILFLVVIGPHQVALASGCDNQLQPIKQLLIFSAPVEPGSIEAKNPGTVQKLRKIGTDLVKVSKDYHAHFSLHIPFRKLQLSEQLSQISKDFAALKNAKTDSRFRGLHSYFNGKLQRFIYEFEKSMLMPQKRQSNLESLARISAGVWELMVACLFDGEEIFLDAHVADMLPKEYKALHIDEKDQQHSINREIDIAVVKNGSWRWIEVKNWDYDSSTNPEKMQKIFHQSQSQDYIRRLIGVPISLELVMRYKLPSKEHDEYLESSAYDKIHFLFR